MYCFQSVKVMVFVEIIVFRKILLIFKIISFSLAFQLKRKALSINFVSFLYPFLLHICILVGVMFYPKQEKVSCFVEFQLSFFVLVILVVFFY